MDTLHAEALRARAEGAYDRAIEAWRALLRRTPEDWRLGLELKRDLKSAFHYPDSDPHFRRAARHLPDAEWLAHYTALYAYHGDDLDRLDRRARQLLDAAPDDVRLHALRGDVARQRGDWAGAEAAFHAAGDAAKAAQARMYRRIALGNGPRDYPVAFVNLDRNTERRAAIEALFPGPLHRIPAVEGARLSAAAVRRLGGDTGMRGTLGCFLSHAAAWEAMLLRGDPHCLVVEDDVVPLLPLPPSLDALRLPPGFDLCFVNDRLEPRLDPDGVAGVSVQGLAEAMRGFAPDDNAPGADGYVISRAGAETLLGWLAEDGFAADVDWRLLAYGLSPAEIAALPPHGHAFAELHRLAPLVRRADRLRAFVLHPALIRTVGVSSDREDENRLGSGPSTAEGC